MGTAGPAPRAVHMRLWLTHMRLWLTRMPPPRSPRPPIVLKMVSWL